MNFGKAINYLIIIHLHGYLSCPKIAIHKTSVYGIRPIILRCSPTDEPLKAYKIL